MANAANIPVTGFVSIDDASIATIRLVPSQNQAQEPVVPPRRRPTFAEVCQQCETGDLVLHPSRAPLLQVEINTTLSNIQKSLRLLPWTKAGPWNEEAG